MADEKKLNLFQRIGKFFREIVGELKKLTWPTPKELATYTLTVLAFIVIMSAIIGLLDLGFGQGFTALSKVDLTSGGEDASAMLRNMLGI